MGWWIWIVAGTYVLAVAAFLRGFCKAAAVADRLSDRVLRFEREPGRAARPGDPAPARDRPRGP